MALMRVKYMGLSDERVIAHNDAGLKARGIKVDKSMKWHAGNGKVIFMDNMSEEMEQMLRDDGAFDVKEVDAETGKTVSDVISVSLYVDDTGGTVVDSTTGQRSTKKS